MGLNEYIALLKPLDFNEVKCLNSGTNWFVSHIVIRAMVCLCHSHEVCSGQQSTLCLSFSCLASVMSLVTRMLWECAFTHHSYSCLSYWLVSNCVDQLSGITLNAQPTSTVYTVVYVKILNVWQLA